MRFASIQVCAFTYYNNMKTQHTQAEMAMQVLKCCRIWFNNYVCNFYI